MSKRIIALVSVTAIVLLCSFPAFANTDMNAETWKNVSGTSSDSKVSYNFQITEGYKEVDCFAMTTNPNSYVRYSSTHYYVWLYVKNDTNTDVQMDQWTFKITLNTNNYLGTDSSNVSYYTGYKITELRPLSDDNFASITRGDASSIAFSPSIKYAYGGKFAIPKQTALVGMYEIVVQSSTSSGNPSWAVTEADDTNITYFTTDFASKTFTSGNFPISAEWYSLQQMAQGVDSSASSSNNTDSNTIDSQATQQHNQEQSYYSNTSSAINNTGIGSYSFSNEQWGGLNGLKNDFTKVYNSLGSWNSVYIFALTLSLALFVIRHVRPKYGGRHG